MAETGGAVGNGKRDFGSFHASNVQELLAIPKDQYIPPPLPVKTEVEIGSPFPFGRNAKKKYFFLEENCCFLNHGAFGASLKLAINNARLWQEYVEKQPLRFFDRELLPLLVHVSRRLADFVGCDAKDLVLINNATFGTNSVLNSLEFGADDVILMFSITYGAVKKLVNHICTKTGSKNRVVNVDFPLSGKQEILEALEKELEKGDIKLVIIDHIHSNTPIIMPVREIIEMCQKKNVLTFVDGAHALGSLPLNISELNPDFYVSNAHKWLASAKGCAFLYVRRDLQDKVRPAVVSHGLGSGFNSEFVWTGLHDYSPFLSLHTVLDFWQKLGPQNIRDYIYKTVQDGADVLMKAWKTNLAAPADMFGSMMLVGLPESVHAMFDTVEYSAGEEIQNILYHDYNIEVPIKCVQGHLYVRISAHIYNDLQDYEKLAKAISMISQGKSNKLL